MYTVEDLKEELVIDLGDEFDDLGFDPDDDINSVRIEYDEKVQQIRQMTAKELQNYIEERNIILSKIPFPKLTENDFEIENNYNFVDIEKLFEFENNEESILYQNKNRPNLDLKYVSEADSNIQEKIEKELEKAVLETGMYSDEEVKELVENGMNSKISDLEDTIDINKIVTKSQSIEDGKSRNGLQESISNMERMENELDHMLEQEGIRKDAYQTFRDENHYVIPFHDDFGNEGLVNICVYEWDDKYHCFTDKKNDEYEAKNERTIKSIKAVRNYINQFDVERASDKHLNTEKKAVRSADFEMER